MQMNLLIIWKDYLIMEYLFSNAHIFTSNIKCEAKWADSLTNMEIYAGCYFTK